MAHPDDEVALLGDRDELRRRHRTAVRVRPARQRLGADQGAGLQIHDRLIGHRDPVILDRRSEVLPDPNAIDEGRPHRGFEEVVSGQAAILGHVHREVGVPDQGVRAVRRPAHRDPDARLGHDRVAVDLDRHRQIGQDPLDDGDHGLGCRRVHEQDGELVAAVARDGIRDPDRARETLGDHAQELVAPVVAERIVDLLEPVEIQEQDRVLLAGPRARQERMGDAVAEQRPVRQGGQSVVQALVLDQAPGRHAHRGRSQHEASVDRRPQHRLLLGGRVVEDRRRVEDPQHRVVQHHEGDRDQERQPALVEGDHPDHHEEVEVHLDVAAGEVHQDTRRDHQAKTGRDRSNGPARQRPRGKRGGEGHGRGLDEAVAETVAHEHAEQDDGRHVQPEQRGDAGMPATPGGLRDRAARRQVWRDRQRDPGQQPGSRRCDDGDGHQTPQSGESPPPMSATIRGRRRVA